MDDSNGTDTPDPALGDETVAPGPDVLGGESAPPETFSNPSEGGVPSQTEPEEPKQPERLSDTDRLNLIAQRLGYHDLDYTEASTD